MVSRVADYPIPLLGGVNLQGWSDCSLGSGPGKDRVGVFGLRFQLGLRFGLRLGFGLGHVQASYG